MELTTIKDLENDFENGFLSSCIDDLTGTDPENVFNVLQDRSWDKVLDAIMLTRHGKKIVDPEQLEEVSTDLLYAQLTVRAYMKERERYFMQQVEYFDAEYNPIENYFQEEHETIDYDRKKKTRDITGTENAYSRTRTRQNPQVITEQYTEANIISTTAQTKTTAEHSVAPFDSDTYHKESKDETTPGTVTSTEQPYNRKFKTPQNTVTDTEALAAPKVETQKIEDAAYKDQDKRDLTRSGNIGVQTSAQMMSLDESFHWNNRWMSKIVLDIVNLIGFQVLEVI